MIDDGCERELWILRFFEHVAGRIGNCIPFQPIDSPFGCLIERQHGRFELDNIEQTLDYRAVSKRVAAFVQESKFHLIETMVEQVAALIRDEFGVSWVRVTVHKPGAVRGSRDVGIAIERGER